jgi:hypothetical protein
VKNAYLYCSLDLGAKIDQTRTDNFEGNIIMRVNTLKYFLIITTMVGCAGSAYAQKIRVVRDSDSANILTVKKAGTDLPSGDLADAVEQDGAGKSTLRMSADKRYEASVFCVPSRSSEAPNCVHRVFILDLQTDENYEIVGEDLGMESNRLIDNLKWINNHTLSYERWASPHIGRRYVVDIKAMKQIDAFVLSDQ